MSDATEILKDACEDEGIVKLNDKAKLERFKMDPSLEKELRTYIVIGKPGRKPFEPSSAEDLVKLIGELEETQSYRDRVNRIAMQSKSIVSDLKLLLEAGTSTMYVKYSDDMKKFSNQQTREAAINFVLRPIVQAVAKWEKLVELAAMSKQNLSDTYFTLKEVGENARKILDERKVKRSFDQ